MVNDFDSRNTIEIARYEGKIMKVIHKNSAFDFDSICRFWYNKDEKSFEYMLTATSKIFSSYMEYQDFLKIVQLYKDNYKDVFCLNEIDDVLMIKKDEEIKELKSKIEKLQKDFENQMTLTGSVDTRTLINLEDRIKNLESAITHGITEVKL